MKNIFIISFILLGSIIFTNNDIRAQVKNEYNINLYNGLSTNYVYNTTVDQLGYLWIATNNGVYRYNGYNVVKYSLAEGLPNNDVWGLTMDSKNRLWLQSITNSVGYFQNNKYHGVYVPSKEKTYYPRGFYEHENKIFFLSPEGGTENLYVVHNDTLHFTGQRFKNAIINDKAELILLSKNFIYSYVLHAGKKPKQQYCAVNRLPYETRSGTYMTSGSYLTYRRHRSSFILKQHLLTGETGEANFTDGAGHNDIISIVFTNNNKIYVLTDRVLHIVDAAFNNIATYPLNAFVNRPDQLAGRISHISESSFWGNIISTRTHGVIINQPGAPVFRKVTGNDLADYKYIGKRADTVSYWWSLNNKILLTMDNNGHMSARQYNFLFDVAKIVPFNKERMLLMTKSSFYWFFINTHTVSPAKLVDVDADLKDAYMYHREVIVPDTNHIFLTGYNFWTSTISGNRIIHKTLHSGGKYSYIELDSLSRAFWLYNNDQILYRPFQGKEVSIHRALFQQYGIKNIEKLIRDKTSGLLFLKDYANLYKIDLVNCTIQKLFQGYNLENTLFYINDNKIILAGKFGVLFCPVNAAGDEAILYSNIKNSSYFKAEDAAVMQHKIILKTDQGFYLLPIPGDDLFKRRSAPLPQYKVILEYRDTLYNIVAQQMFYIVPGARNLGIDIINPQGNGALTVQYFIAGVDKSWNILNGNKIVLPALVPSKKYVLYLKAGDEVWNSKLVSVVLYMTPLWWQKRSWQITFWLAGSVVALSILLAVMLLTRGYVIRAGRKKQNSIMLELRAIYAQLNPHFIFNTLNTALYFIKKKQMENAATHVTTFSHLLRAYLESSKNRYISIDEEITNLKNYIQLEQKRFENIFTYEIINHTTPHETIYIPSLLLQPIVENAINHGLLPKGNAGHLKIEFHRNADKSIVCIVEDNGIGRQQAEALKQEHASARPSHGNRLIRELIDAFNKYEKLGIEITYTDKTTPLSGTLVTILIKAPYDK